jgi:predicted nucleotidyltransferase
MARTNPGNSEIIQILRTYRQEVAARYGLQAIGVFGSVARGEHRPDSDVDVVVRIARPDLFILVDIKQELEARLHRPVDVVTYRESMNPFLKQRIDREAVYA